MIDDLHSQMNEHPNIGVACLYADYKDQSSQTLAHILGSFLHQFLTSAQQPIPDEVVQILRTIRNQAKKVEAEDILAMLEIWLHQFKRAFICIDAIDELEPKVLQQLLNVFKVLVTKNIRLLLTGRDHIESEVHKHLRVTPQYKVMVSASHEDIQEFIKQQIMDDLNPDAMDEALAKDIVDTIIKKSRGMYITIQKL